MMNRLILSLILCFTGQFIVAQKIVPIIKATSDKTYFIEGKSETKNNWWLDPSISPDVYRMDKISKSTRIDFYTDISSLSVKLKPGEQYDFIVILNEKDSCFTRIVAPSSINKYENLSPATHDTIPFELTDGNNIKIKVLLNDTDSLDLYFDSGGTSIVLTHEAIANKTSLLADKEAGYKTQNYVPLPSLNTLKIGKTSWDKLIIYPVAVSGQDTDGHFGWNLFDGRIVELDYDQQIFVIHSSLPKSPKGYAKLDIEYINTLFCVQGHLAASGKKYKSRFLFDTGYQRAILLDSVYMKEQHFPKDLPTIKTTSLTNGAGTVFYTKINTAFVV